MNHEYVGQRIHGLLKKKAPREREIKLIGAFSKYPWKMVMGYFPEDWQCWYKQTKKYMKLDIKYLVLVIQCTQRNHLKYNNLTKVTLKT